MNGKLSNSGQLCSVRRAQCVGGRANGEHILSVENGCLSFTVLESRAMDLYDFRYRGENIAFLSKNGLCGFEGAFDDVFPGGMLYTCGLDTVGGRALPIHGKLHNIPATAEKILCDGERIELEGTVRQSGLFGENLVLRRRITTEYGSGKVTVENEIVNEGFGDAEYCLLFHINFGYPFLDEGVEVRAPTVSTQPRTPWAEKNLCECFHMTAPTEREEQVFFHKAERGEVTVINPRKGLCAEIGYDGEALPHLIEWKSMVAGTYALGIEPSTTTLDGEFCKKPIRAGEIHRYVVTIHIKEEW